MPHTWHDMSRIGILSRSRIFQSTCHIRGMTHLLGHICVQLVISIHMPHTWHDDVIGRPNLSDESISIHMPHTWHDALDPRKIRSSADISIHMPHTCHIRGMTNSGCSSILVLNISIHMPHTWHDYAAWADAVRKIISIHMPHTWHDVYNLRVIG